MGVWVSASFHIFALTEGGNVLVGKCPGNMSEGEMSYPQDIPWLFPHGQFPADNFPLRIGHSSSESPCELAWLWGDGTRPLDPSLPH